MRKTKIKICGITSTEEMKWLIEEEVEYAGIVLFYKESRRYCTLEQAESMIKMVKKQMVQSRITLVAVCVSPTVDQVDLVWKMGFDMIQIHGELSQEVLKRCQIPVIRAYHFQQNSEEVSFEEQNLAGILLDAAKPGSGEAFDWKQLDQGNIERIRRAGMQFFLAGGLQCENVRAAISCADPDVVDCSSGVEQDGIKGKDREKIRKFVSEVRRYE